MTNQFTKPNPNDDRNTFPVTVGYHTFRLHLGESVEIDPSGWVHIKDCSGNLRKTKKNIKTRPTHYAGGPLIGDMMTMSQVDPFYKEKVQKKVHPMFKAWKMLIAMSGGKLKFQHFGDSGKYGEQLFCLRIGDYLLVADSETPDALLYVTEGGEKFFNVIGTHADNIPLTVEYVKETGKDYTRFLRDEEKKRMAELGSQPEPQKKLTKKQLARLKRQEAQEELKRRASQEALMMDLAIKEATYELNIKTSHGTPIISNNASRIAMGLPVKEAELESDARAREGDKLTKEQLAARASEIYKQMKKEREPK